MDLEVWLNKIRQTRSHAEVFAILDEFRTHEWTDEQCSKIARLYMRMLDNFGPINHDEAAGDEKTGSGGDKKDSKNSKDAKDPKSKNAKEGQLKEAVAAAAGAASSGTSAVDTEEIKPVTTGATPVNDGPVWYEKM